mgnify:CR=1 FL=1
MIDCPRERDGLNIGCLGSRGQDLFQITPGGSKIIVDLENDKMNQKRKRPKNRRAGCLMCKSWKINGFNRRQRKDGERFSDHKRRYFAEEDVVQYYRAGSLSINQ